MAAALGPDDSPALHAADTIAAGDGLCDPGVVELFAARGAGGDRSLARLGVALRPDARRRLRARPRGGARAPPHRPCRRRRRGARGHARADRGGARDASIDRARRLRGAPPRSSRTTPSAASSPSARRGRCCSPPSAVVIATGGIGGLFEDSTNPLGSFGQGLALAARAGAALADLEFVQFHPTALDVAVRPTPLVSEAVRGEGARPRRRDRPALHGRRSRRRARAARRRRARHLAPSARRAGARSSTRARRSARDFATRFPAIAAACRDGRRRSRARADPGPARRSTITWAASPWTPEGASSVAGLWACGEAACDRAARRQPAREQFADRGRRVRRDRRPLDRGASRPDRPRRRVRHGACRAPRSGAGAADPVDAPPASSATARPRRRGRPRSRTSPRSRTGRPPIPPRSR